MKQKLLAESTIMLNGRIQKLIFNEDSVCRQLSSVELSSGEKNWDFQKQFYTFLKKYRICNFYRGRQLKVIGLLSEVSIDKNRLILGFTDFRYRKAVFPQN